MAVSGVRARNFIRGGTASSIFAARRGMSAARPARAAAPRGETAKFGKASGRDYANFLSSDKTTKALRSTVANLKNMLVEGFQAAKSLQTSVGNIAGQLKGSGGGRGGKGIGLFGIFAAIAIAVGAIFAPKIKEAIKFLYNQVKNIFKIVQGALRKVDEVVQGIYKGVQNFVEGVTNFIGGINNAIRGINDRIDAIFKFFGQDKGPAIPELPNFKQDFLPDYNGLDFLKEEYNLDNLLGDTVSGAGNMLGNMFGGARDMFQGMLGGLLGGTPKAPAPAPPTAPSTSGQNTSGGGYQAGNVPAAVANDTSFQQGVTDLAKKYDLSEDDLYAVMSFETGGTFDPAQKNMAGSGATGLIQFMPSTARGLGTTTDELAGMTRTEQLKYVDKYFSNKGIQGGNLDDLYMSILFPAAVGKPDDYVLFGKGAMDGYRGTAYDQNRGLDANNDGSITKAEAAASARKHKLEPVSSNPSVPGRSSNISLINTPGQQIAQAPPRPRPLTSTNPPGGSSSPTVAFYGSSNPDSFDHVLAKATYSVTG
tara:strand:+ start:357 stop:1964 length:1608 start_codon:yes stop_codon:yes gene_type:complete